MQNKRHVNEALLLRRAVVDTLIVAFPEALSIAEITGRVLDVRPLDQIVGPLTPKRISDLLRFQVTSGRARRVRIGLYVAVPAAMSRTTRWRHRTWPRQFDELCAARLRWTIASAGPSPIDEEFGRDVA